MENEKLDKIIFLLQGLFILEAKKRGAISEDVRNLLGMNNNIVSKFWKLKLKIDDNKKEEKAKK